MSAKVMSITMDELVDEGKPAPAFFQIGYAAAISDVFGFIDRVISDGSASLDISEIKQFRIELEQEINRKGII